MSEELILSPQIRRWVFLPLFILSILEGILLHFLTILLISNEQLIELDEIECTEALNRSCLLRKNGHLLTKASFTMRRNFFNKADNGYFIEMINHRTSLSSSASVLPSVVDVNKFLTDPNLFKGHLINIIPMIIGGNWINSVFTGLITTRFPFTLPLYVLKIILQRGINLESLDPSWISSQSWYFLNVIVTRNIYSSLLYYNNHCDLKNSNSNRIEFKLICKNEWETLELFEHVWILMGIVDDFV